MAANWFVALPVPAGPWFEALDAPPGVRMFAPEDLHLTLAFLGPVSAERARAAFARVQTPPLQQLEIGLAEVEALGSRRRPSAFSALLDQGRAQVESAIAALRDELCDAAGAMRDTRPPLAHITLARPVRSITREQLRAARAWAAGLKLAGTRAFVSRIALFTWSQARTPDTPPAPAGSPAAARPPRVDSSAGSPAAARPPRFCIDREHPLQR
jgi:RNA 2',3'-cyclic 3'-phosphodiesterase